MLIAFRKEHLQDTEPFLRAFRFGGSDISIQRHTLSYYVQSNSFTNSFKWIQYQNVYMVIYEAVQKSYFGGSFGSSVDKKNEEGIM